MHLILNSLSPTTPNKPRLNMQVRSFVPFSPRSILINYLCAYRTEREIRRFISRSNRALQKSP